MPLLRGKLHLPRRAAPGGELDDPHGPQSALAQDPGARGGEQAIGDTHLHVLDGGTVDPVAGSGVSPADGGDVAPAPLHPVALRQVPAGRAPARPRRAPKASAAGSATLIPDDEPLAGAEPERPLRVVLIEEMTEVTAHVREMVRGQPTLRLVGVVADGRKAVGEAKELRADVALVDALLQGRLPGVEVMERLRAAIPGLAVVALGTSDDPQLADRVRAAADAIVTLPFGTIDLARGIRHAHDGAAARDPARTTRVVAVYAAKGGVGKSTLALNLAVGLAAAGTRTALVDGSLQYGDLRRLLRVDPEEPSICDLPTDCVRASDLVGRMRRGPAGVDILFAPPRLEMADMVTARDLDKILDLLRRTYQAVVVDTPSALNDTTLTVLDVADVILQVLTPEPAALDSTRAAAAAFEAIGYPPTKVRIVINRAGTQGGLRPDQLRRALGRDPDHVVASDWQLVSAANQEGRPFVIVRPDAPVSRDVLALGAAMLGVVGAGASPLPARLRTRSRSRARAS